MRCPVYGRVQRSPQTAFSIWYDGASSDLGSGRCQGLGTGSAGHRCREVGCSLRPKVPGLGSGGYPAHPACRYRLWNSGYGGSGETTGETTPNGGDNSEWGGGDNSKRGRQLRGRQLQTGETTPNGGDNSEQGETTPNGRRQLRTGGGGRQLQMGETTPRGSRETEHTHWMCVVLRSKTTHIQCVCCSK